MPRFKPKPLAADKDPMKALLRSLTVVARPALGATALGCAALLAGCDQLGIEDPAKIAAAKEADAKAIGGACRNALRAIEDCYALNPKAQKAAVYEGWREMDEYMRENKLEGTRPVVANQAAASKPADAASDEEDATPRSAKGKVGDAPADKGSSKSGH
jgi:hypothetical protein